MRDSLRLFADALKKLGEHLGLEKLDVDRTSSGIAALSDEECEAYCFRDCEIVLLAVTKMRDFITSLGGEFTATLPGCAARTIQALCVPSDAYGWSPETDEIAAKAFAGGHVDVYQRRMPSGDLADVNSMYPGQMVKPLPTRYKGNGNGKLPKDSGEFYVVKARVSVPLDCYDSPLWVQPKEGALAGRLVFPTGNFEGVWTREELETAADTIPGFTFEPIRWHSWEQSPWLAETIGGWYEKRKKSESSVEQYMLKLLMNSAYGKFIEKSENETLTQSLEEALRLEKMGGKLRLHTTNVGAIYGVSSVTVGILRHAAVAAAITSRARLQLYNAMNSIRRKGGQVAYCDTDSVFSTVMPDDVDPKRLGAWKHECSFLDGEFIAPKLYSYLALAKRIPKANKFVVKCKGYPKAITNADGESERLPSDELWRQIKNSEEMRSEKTRLFRSMLREGEVKFARETVSRMRGDIQVDKRCFTGNDSRPWTCDEVDALTYPEAPKHAWLLKRIFANEESR